MFRPLILASAMLILLAACTRKTSNAAYKSFVDSLMVHYTLPASVAENDEEMGFWKNRIDPKNPGITNESRYASKLMTRFREFGDIKDALKADSILRSIDSLFRHKEAHPLLSLASYSISRHRFRQADTLLQEAKSIGLRRYEWLTSYFDVNFENGRYDNAQIALNQLQTEKDYGYYFRLSKMEHLNGDLDSAVSAMLTAASLSGNSEYLKQVALSNAGDLYMHCGKGDQAAELYIQSIRINSVDFHSLLGLGWIALVYDKDDSLAERVFRFVASRNRLPDGLFKLSQMEDARGDKAMQKKYAVEFERAATDPVYGNMYNKYLIELYTNVLHDPSRADALSRREIDNRATPQTWAWRAWSLYANGKRDEAYHTYEEHVSGKPLEGLELYYMGKLMQGLNKGYNAMEFFRAAEKNKYDLSPCIMKDLEKELK